MINPKLSLPTVRKIARLKTTLFRFEHPDIKAGSLKEKKIIELFKTGEDLQTAYKIVDYFYKHKQIQD